MCISQNTLNYVVYRIRIKPSARSSWEVVSLMSALHQAKGETKTRNKPSVHYVDIVPKLIVLFKRIYGLSKTMRVDFYNSAMYKDIVVVVRDTVSKLFHVIVVKISERYAVPPSVFEQYTEREWRRLQRLLTFDDMQKADFTVFIAGQLTSGAMKQSYVAKRLSRKTCLVYALQTKHRTIKSIIKKIIDIIHNYYSKRLQAIRQKIERMKEQGIEEREIERMEITNLSTILRTIVLMLPSLTT